MANYCRAGIKSLRGTTIVTDNTSIESILVPPLFVYILSKNTSILFKGLVCIFSLSQLPVFLPLPDLAQGRGN
jgi:hypothetical protein